jgi:hypothetical protein
MLLFGPREEEKREARSMLQAAEADFTLAKEEFDREQRLAGAASSRTNCDTFGVKIQVPDPKGAFKAGMAAMVFFDRPAAEAPPRLNSSVSE